MIGQISARTSFELASVMEFGFNRLLPVTDKSVGGMLMFQLAPSCYAFIILSYIYIQGRRSLWATRSPIFGPGDAITNVHPHYLRSQVKSSDYMCTL